MCDVMNFPESVEEFMNAYKIVDTEHVYTNGAEMVPIFRMEQWFDHLPPAQSWIPCAERLPEPRMAVLGYAPKYQNIFAVYYDSAYGWMIWSPIRDDCFPNSQGEITAWMPLPEPWKGGRMKNAELFQKIFGVYATEVWAKNEKDFLDWLNTEVHAAPVLEVKRGKWIPHKDYPGLAWLCSECNLFTTDRSYYCPCCGAEMEEE